MRFLFCFWIFFTFSVSVFSQDGFQFETDKTKITIPFQLINNLIFIPINVNGVELNFLLDTGVEETILLSLDDKEGLNFNNVEKIKRTSISGKSITPQAWIDHFHLGKCLWHR